MEGSSKRESICVGLRNCPQEVRVDRNKLTLKKIARRRYRSRMNQFVREGKYDKMCKPVLTDWDLW